jgi:hypothetical protein
MLSAVIILQTLSPIASCLLTLVLDLAWFLSVLFVECYAITFGAGGV